MQSLSVSVARGKSASLALSLGWLDAHEDAKTGAPDPVFSAIEDHKQVLAEMQLTDPDDEDAFSESCDRPVSVGHSHVDFGRPVALGLVSATSVSTSTAAASIASSASPVMTWPSHRARAAAR
jgi:hypothetical protein